MKKIKRGGGGAHPLRAHIKGQKKGKFRGGGGKHC